MQVSIFHLAQRAVSPSVVLPVLALLVTTAGVGAQDEPASGIFEAARTGDMGLVRSLLNDEAELIGATDGDGLTPLHHAVLGRHVALTELLLDRGANLEAVDAQNRTPLHHAAFQGDAECVAVLLAHGSDVTVREFRGRTPLFLAVNWGRNLEIVLKYAGSDDAGDIGIPEKRYGICLNQDIFEDVIVSLGYIRDDYDEVEDVDEREERDLVFAQLAIEF